MVTRIDGSTGVDKIQDGTVVQADLAAGVAGNGPVFGATFTGTTILAIVPTTMVASSVEFDTANAYDPLTGRFTPQVAGYYQVNAEVGGAASVAGLEVRIDKNNVSAMSINQTGTGPAQAFQRIGCSTVVYMNGSTDFLTVIGYVASGSLTAVGRFSGSLVRAA